jgi:hypothetical protein
MSVIDNDYIVLYYYSNGSVFSTKHTTGWRRHTLSVQLGSVPVAGMEMFPGRLTGPAYRAVSRRTFSSLPGFGVEARGRFYLFHRFFSAFCWIFDGF